jgi:hypothetical protein
LPAYTDEPATLSLTDNLTNAGSKLTARRVNPVIEKLGYQEHLERHSNSKGIKKFWNITEAGLKYGKNIAHNENPRDTQPHWYVLTFKDLLSEVEAFLAQADVIHADFTTEQE